MSVGTSRVAVAGGSPVPVFRAKRGNAPPLTCSRIRCPGTNWYAIELIGTVTVSWPGLSLMMPSVTFWDRPRASTSQSRAKM